MEDNFDAFLLQQASIPTNLGPPVTSLQVLTRRGGPEEEDDRHGDFDDQTMVSEVTMPPLTLDPLRTGRSLYQAPALQIPEDPDDAEVTALFGNNSTSKTTTSNDNSSSHCGMEEKDMIKEAASSLQNIKRNSFVVSEPLPTLKESKEYTGSKKTVVQSNEEPQLVAISKVKEYKLGVPSSSNNASEKGTDDAINKERLEKEKVKQQLSKPKELEFFGYSNEKKMDMMNENMPVEVGKDKHGEASLIKQKEDESSVGQAQQDDGLDPIFTIPPPLPSGETDPASAPNNEDNMRAGAYAAAPGVTQPERIPSSTLSRHPSSGHLSLTTLTSVSTPAEEHDTELGRERGEPVANLVVDDDGNLPQAQEMNGHTTKAAQRRRSKGVNVGLLLGPIALMALAVVLVVFLVSGNNNDKEEDDIQAPTSPPTVLTASPSEAPSMSLEGNIKALLDEDTLLALEDPKSPQFRAYWWLLEDRENLPSYSDSRIKQKLALATLYYATGGENWVANTNWLDHEIHECYWFTAPEFGRKTLMGHFYPGYLSEFFPPTEPLPYTCNADALYQHLWLDGNNLVGSLPEELYMLSMLQTLSLDGNTLDGTLSSQVSRLTDLEGLSIYGQPPKGGIPSEIGTLTKLRGLVLVNSQHEAPLPDELWKLTNLQTLILMDQPNMPSSIPSEIGLFSSLKWLIMANSALYGTIPTEIGAIESLEYIVAFQNRFDSGQKRLLSGTIPTELATFPSRKTFISLGGNRLTGTLPTELGLLSSVFMLTLGENPITGTIPSEIGLMSSLQLGMALGITLLTGTIPTELGQLTKIQNLWLGNNGLTGQIPSEFGELTSLGNLVFANNSLSGPIPQEFSSLQQSLHTLDFVGNPLLSGTVPEGICTLNGTYFRHPLVLDPFFEPLSLSFDCTELLCGCSCSCGSNV